MKYLLTVAALVCLLCGSSHGEVSAALSPSNLTGPTWNGLSVDWRLPLNLGVTDAAPTLLFATDGSTIYTTDSRGTIFAVNSADGSLRWSNAGSSMLQQFVLFRERPSVLYVLINRDWYFHADGQSFKQLSWELVAINTTDGTELGRLANVTGGSSSAPLDYVQRTEDGIATVTSLDGLVVTDAALNVVWNRTMPNSTQFPFPSYARIATSKTLVVALLKATYDQTRQHLVSYDVKTGKPVCEVGHMTGTWNYQLEMTFQMGWHSNIVVGARAHMVYHHGSSSEYLGNFTQVDAMTCKVFYRGIVQDSKFFGLQNALLDGDVLLDANLTHVFRPTRTGHYVIQSYSLGAADVNWRRNLSDYNNGTASPFPPTFSNMPFQDDVTVVWNSGVLTALNKTNGDTLWSFSSDRVPVAYSYAPARQQQFVYPLGKSELFVPNLQGFVTLNVKTGTLGTVVLDFPLAAAASAKSAISGQPIVVVAEPISGDLIALKKMH